MSRLVLDNGLLVTRKRARRLRTSYNRLARERCRWCGMPPWLPVFFGHSICARTKGKPEQPKRILVPIMRAP